MRRTVARVWRRTQGADCCSASMGAVSSTVSTLVVCWNNSGLPGSLPRVRTLRVGTDRCRQRVKRRQRRSRRRALSLREARFGFRRNAGFAAGVNRAASEATGTYLLLLNPDAEATPRAIERPDDVPRRASGVRRRRRPSPVDDRRAAARLPRRAPADNAEPCGGVAARQAAVAPQSDHAAC